MKLLIHFSFFIFFPLFSLGQDSIIKYQISFPRVSAAYNMQKTKVEYMFYKKGITFPPNRIFWRAFKWNKKLELWAFSSDSFRYIKVHTFPICAIVGDLGPKREQGDFQIPEGFYIIESFNPNSHYHLSLRVSYPNESDKILGEQGNLGGDIYIHGGCETIGCLPMTDELIEQIYIINIFAQSAGQHEIPIHIFPTKLTYNNMNKLKREYFNGRTEVLRFWENIKEGYDFFEEKGVLPLISIDNKGRYVFE